MADSIDERLTILERLMGDMQPDLIARLGRLDDGLAHLSHEVAGHGRRFEAVEVDVRDLRSCVTVQSLTYEREIAEVKSSIHGFATSVDRQSERVEVYSQQFIGLMRRVGDQGEHITALSDRFDQQAANFVHIVERLDDQYKRLDEQSVQQSNIERMLEEVLRRLPVS